MDAETMQNIMLDIIEAYLGDGSASHYLSAAFTATPYSFRARKIENITNALEVAAWAWKSYDDAEQAQKYSFNALRRSSVAAGEQITNALEAFISHQLVQHQEQGTPFPEAMTDIQRQWREFADNDAVFLPFVSAAQRRREAEHEDLR